MIQSTPTCIHESENDGNLSMLSLCFGIDLTSRIRFYVDTLY